MFLLGSPFLYMSLILAATLFTAFKIKGDNPFIKTFSINVVSLLILLAAFDTVALRFSPKEDFRIDHYYYHHGLKPMVSEETRWGSIHENLYSFYTNSLSFRDFKPVEVSLKKSGKRFIVLGDSFVEGVGYPYEETLAGIVTKHLEKKGIEVLNPSAISYSPKLYYLRMKYLIEQGFEFDELFLFIDTSDIIDEIFYDYFKPVILEGFLKKLRPFDRLFSHSSYIYRELKLKYLEQINPRGAEYWGGIEKFYGLKGQWTYNKDAYEFYGKEGIELAKKHVTALNKLCLENGAKMHIVVWPWHENLIRGSRDERKQKQLWEQFSQENNIPFIQMFDLFYSLDEGEIDSYFIPKDIHWTDKGHKIAGEFMVNFFISYLDN